MSTLLHFASPFNCLSDVYKLCRANVVAAATARQCQLWGHVLEFFPKAADRYRQKVAHIHAALNRGEAGDREAIAQVRSLIGRIVVHATPAPEPLGLEVEASLAALMSDAPDLEHSGISCRKPSI